MMMPQEANAMRGLHAAAVLLVVILLVSTLYVALTAPIDADEVEHTHVAWLLSQGILPYRDIHQLHAPLTWLVFAPILRLMPESAATIVALRMVCLLAFFGGSFFGLLMLRRMAPGTPFLFVFLYAVLCAASLLPVEADRFRADPFMTVMAILGIYFAARIRNASWRLPYLSGLAFGLAAGFSPKMAPLCLLIPVISSLESLRCRSWRPLLVCLANLAGFLTGILPVVVWVLCSGLSEAFVRWTVVGNALTLNFPSLLDISLAALRVPATVLGPAALLLLFFTRASSASSQAYGWRPRWTVIVATILAYAIFLAEPNHLPYNLQCFVVPACLSITLALYRLAGRFVGTRRFWMAAGLPVLVLVGMHLCYVAPIQVGGMVINHRRWSWTIPQVDLERLIRLAKATGGPCVAPAPEHPVFCRDATEFYLRWDLGLLTEPWVPEAARAAYREIVRKAVQSIESGAPALVAREEWIRSVALSKGIITEEEAARLKTAIGRFYVPETVGTLPVLIRRETRQSPATEQ
jgi:hypothetical protein